MVKTPVYLDYHATTPVDPRVANAMVPFLTEHFGNPASRQHKYGWVAEEAVDQSRKTTARLLNSEPREVYFTSGATESNNLAIKGAVEAYSQKGKHLIASQIEHKSVLDVCRNLAKKGYDVTFLPVDQYGLIDLNQLKEAIKDSTVLVSIMIANNEIGTIQNTVEIGKLCRSLDVLFHTDATQAVGKITVDIQAAHIDLLSLSGHKLYGPKGIGALFVRNKNPRVKVITQLHGGGHERGLRSGTLNVPGVVGLARALDLCFETMTEEAARLRALRDKLESRLLNELEDTYVNGHPDQRLPNNLNMSFLHAEENAIMMGMKDIAVASGSACSSAEPEPSHVLKALHVGKGRETSAIRFGLGRWTTEEEIDYAADRTIDTVKKLRSMSPLRSKPEIGVH